MMKIPPRMTLKNIQGVSISLLPDALLFSSSSKSSTAALKSSAVSIQPNATKKLTEVFMKSIGNKNSTLSPKFNIINVKKLLNKPMVKKQMTSLERAEKKLIVSGLKKTFLLILPYP